MNLHQQFVKLGQDHKIIVYKIQAILPRIYNEGIYKKYADDIYEYARKYAGVSSGVVDKIIHTYTKIADKPALQMAIKTAGIHKVALVANLATKHNQEILAKKVCTMSKAAVVQFAKDTRGNTNDTLKIELDSEMQFLFNQLKPENMSNKEALRQILLGLTQNTKPPQSKNFPGEKAKSRYIPAKNKQATIHKTNGKCAFQNCHKPYSHIHHIKPFSESKNHHPDNLMPLYKEHHEIMHNGDSKTDRMYQTYTQTISSRPWPTPMVLTGMPSSSWINCT